MILPLVLLSSCWLDCAEKKPRPKLSSGINEAKEKGVFQFRVYPDKQVIKLDSGMVYKIAETWVERAWSWDCVDNDPIVKKDSFFQLVVRKEEDNYSIDKLSDYHLWDQDRNRACNITGACFFSYEDEIPKLYLYKKAYGDVYKELIDSISFSRLPVE